MPWYRPAVQCVAPPAQACGLYYMAELAEEYSRLTKKILTYCIQGVIAIHVLLLVSMSGSARHLSAADQGPASPVLPPHVAHSAGCRARCSSRTHIYTCPHVDTPTRIRQLLDGFPFFTTIFGIGLHVVYYQVRMRLRGGRVGVHVDEMQREAVWVLVGYLSVLRLWVCFFIMSTHVRGHVRGMLSTRTRKQ